MIWINISNILQETKFTGIVRTEYELCNYAYQLYEQGQPIGFCQFNELTGFIKLDYALIQETLFNLKHGKATLTKQNRKNKLMRSVLKRLNKLKLLFGKINHCFQDGDVIISAGQKLGTAEMRSLLLIKKYVNVQFKLLCHDLMPINYPEFVASGNNNLFERYFNEAMLVVDHFYCNSEFTKNEIEDYYTKLGTDTPSMSVVTLGCDLYTKHSSTQQNALIEYITSKPYIIFVSTIEARKNHQLIYDMYITLIEQGIENLPKVCFIGRRGWKVEKLLNALDQDTRIKDKIMILDNISDENLVTLYKNCWFTLYPSFIEGYGLPVAESLSFGKYCLSSNAGSLPEAGGDFIDYINPYDINKWSEKFLFLINNPEYIQEREQKICTDYYPTSWEACAKQLLDIEFQQKK